MSYYLCEDLIDEIFIRLPLKSLVRNTSLSKSWHSRISTPSFIRKHTLRSATTQLPPQKYYLRTNRHYFRSIKLLTISTKCISLEKKYTTLEAVKQPFHQEYRLSFRFMIVGSCNGIICLSNQDVHSITLWNPSIRRKLTVPAHPSCNKRTVSFGFGFDPISDDYKIVAMHMSNSNYESSFIYPLKKNSWSKIVTPILNADYDRSSCFFNGRLHWVVRCDKNGINRNRIMTFDLSTNVFGLISLPKPSLRFENLMIIKGCLAVMFISHEEHNNCSIWVMREYNNVASWTKAFDVSEGLLMNEDHKDSISYNYESQTRSRLIVDSSYKVDLDMCVESLELLDKDIVGDDTYFLYRCWVH